ncbi:DUF6716 putative glycosyltransferase [Actinorhabdospora filicis]|uniref:DUF6716 putative glycosyltransferase n=1 Tax=Actinorhabdospora filicis TaxID=1785913 RepID=UPI002555B8F0|nr:DUF6716 putative glycosyltransferase [Actinorhabdospora filicis]
MDVLADSDTRWKWGALLARRLDPGCRLTARFLHARSTPTARQLEEVGVRPDGMTEAPLVDYLADAELAETDVLILATTGGVAQSAMHGFARRWAGRERRPILVTGYVGVVYEKMTDGLLLRAGADVVLANSAFDADRFRTVYDGVGVPSSSIVETGLPFLHGRTYDADAVARGERRYTVCFAAQPSSPQSKGERLHILERAARHARLHPERDVLVKLRSLPGEHTTHLEDFPYQLLLSKVEGVPANLRLVYGNMGEVLDGTDLSVTVSSTAALESMQRGIPTAILTDLGVREALGNHYFVSSGCLASWDELDAGAAPVADPAWLRANGVLPNDADPFVALRERLDELVAERDANGLPELRPYYSMSRAGGYLSGLLRRQGLEEDGGPRPRSPEGSGRSAVRRFARRSMRSAYRVAANRLAPVIRRWGQL